MTTKNDRKETGTDSAINRRNMLLGGTILAAATALGSTNPIPAATAQAGGSKPNILA